MNFEMNESILEMTIERAIDEAKAGNDAGALFFSIQIRGDRTK